MGVKGIGGSDDVREAKIKWHRMTVRQNGVPILVYYTNEKDWAAWSIDRLPTSNGSRTFWYVYQVMKNGSPIGLKQATLRDAKRLVERTGREA
jgi:hypothetical protein